ncbi:MAG: branched-chain amino acid ABC transporter permease [Betaproteobacteria bacterium]|jgi:branched-chain amino acid transport system permease protein|nr:branched-chain amino acid ABC transporter permease [Betaproteobacteria bacterium]
MRFDYHTQYRQGFALFKDNSDRILYALLLTVMCAVPWLASSFVLGELAYVFILCIASLGLMVLIGYTGQVSLGHAAFVAVGAYAHVWMMNKGLPMLTSMLSAAGISAIAGLVVGIPAIRVSGLYLAMVTMAFAIVIEQVIGNWSSVTGGFTGMPVPDAQIGKWSLSGPKSFYYFCLVLLVLVVVSLFNLLRSALGRSFMGVRESEAASYALGIQVNQVKIIAFGLSAGVTGLAGALLAHHLKYLTPDGFSLLLSLELVLMVVIGGVGSLRGAILGGLLISLLPTLISNIKPWLPQAWSKQSGFETFIFGFILAFFVLFEPTGLNGRWLKFVSLIESFPLYRKDTFKRNKRYMKSERYR